MGRKLFFFFREIRLYILYSFARWFEIYHYFRIGTKLEWKKIEKRIRILGLLHAFFLVFSLSLFSAQIFFQNFFTFLLCSSPASFSANISLRHAFVRALWVNMYKHYFLQMLHFCQDLPSNVTVRCDIWIWDIGFCRELKALSNAMWTKFSDIFDLFLPEHFV